MDGSGCIDDGGRSGFDPAAVAGFAGTGADGWARVASGFAASPGFATSWGLPDWGLPDWGLSVSGAGALGST
ncbi:MAG: hypothetical protein J2P47_12890, partial [Acetobacteraceae bacterium]|nr:hypothetical protein [Acetobacteraceae bacterium]